MRFSYIRVFSIQKGLLFSVIFYEGRGRLLALSHSFHNPLCFVSTKLLYSTCFQTVPRNKRLFSTMPSNDEPRSLRRSPRILQCSNSEESTLDRKRKFSSKNSEDKAETLISSVETESNSNEECPDEKLLLMDLGRLIKGKLMQRPSVEIKSAYVADVALLDEDEVAGDIVQAHAPALNAGGLCVPSSLVFMTERPPGGKTSHAIELVLAPPPNKEGVEGDNGILVGVHPRLGEALTEMALKRGLLEGIIGYGEAKLCANASSPKNKKNKAEDNTLLEGIVLQKQCTFGDSRVDFQLTDHGSSRPPLLIEVKNVVCSDYAADLAPKKTGPNHCVIKSISENYSRSAIFPWGLRAQKFEGQRVVSERAIKHLRNLGDVEATNEDIKTAVIFVINRSDCEHMRACHEQCPIFAKELKVVAGKGCIVASFRVKWTQDGKAFFDGIVPVTL